MKTEEDFKKLSDYVEYLQEAIYSVELSVSQHAEVVHELIRIKQERRLRKDLIRNEKQAYKDGKDIVKQNKKTYRVERGEIKITLRTDKLLSKYIKLKPRYLKIIEIIKEIRPESIIEVGTWNGSTALCMIFEALKYQEKVTYTGYDLFENITDEINKQERNAKATVTKLKVMTSFDTFIANVKIIKEIVGELQYKLITGNTRDVLEDSYADLVFIDGGHSVETIRSDYNHVKESKVVIFDDYYLLDQYGNIPDLTKFGCNSIVDQLDNVEIFKCYPGDEEGGRIIKTAIAIVRNK